MNNDLISREALIVTIMDTGGWTYTNDEDLAIELARTAPAVDAVEVVHAKWEFMGNNGVYEQGCSNCGFCPGIRFWSSDYCPNCGARMDGEKYAVD